jgi:hypothetical protein
LPTGGDGGKGGVLMVAVAAVLAMRQQSKQRQQQQHDNNTTTNTTTNKTARIIEWRERNHVQNYVFFSVQVCLNPWTLKKTIVLNIVLLRQADLQIYLFWGGKGMFLCFYVKKMCLWTPT